LFERIVVQCVSAGLVQGEHLSVDGTFVQANANNESRIPREQLGEAAQVKRGAREYLRDLERDNGDDGPVNQQDKISTTDPDATCASKGNTAAKLGYYDNYLVDNASCIVVGVQGTSARLSQDSVAARSMIEDYQDRYGRLPRSLAADNTYGNGEMLHWLDERGITPY